MADKIVVMQDGYSEQIGSPLDLYDRPINVFVASFIGSPSMNMTDGVAAGGKDRYIAIHGLKLPIQDMEATEDGHEVIVGVRPEHLELADSGIPAVVSVVEPTGAETHVILKFGDQDLVAVFRERHNFRPGQKIHLLPTPGFVHVFDRKTGKKML